MKPSQKQPSQQSPQKPTKTSISSTEDIATLLQYQQKLLNLIHAEVYALPQINEDVIVKFQVNHVSEMNQAWKRMVDDLMFRLVKQKMEYDSTLRDHFHRVLLVDYLPFLRINRYQLTQVSLFGFDIYIEPLSTMLQIINRIQGQYHIISSRVPPSPVQFSLKSRPVWQSIKKGWNQFMYQSSLCKVSLNVCILKQYLKIAAKSLVKKDKDIIFTGCFNMFNYFVPVLLRNGQIWLLVQFSQLNNQLYQFHPSFNYSHFYSLLLPIRDQYEPIFKSIQYIAQKCLNANILTPLLFAILRNKSAFMEFIDGVDSLIWAPYLNGIVFGLIYNFKARILQYQQAMNILQAAILKLGVMGQLQTSYFVGQLGKQWSQARDFFISALKVGYNVGELQTWHPTQFPLIQQKILYFTKNSLLLHPSLPTNTNVKLYFPDSFDAELQTVLLQLTGNLLNRNQFVNSFSPNICDAVVLNQSSLYGLLKLAQLIKDCKLQANVNCMCYVFLFLGKVGDVASGLLRDRLRDIGERFCENAIKQLQRQQKGRQDLKQTLFSYIKKNKPVSKLNQIIRICLTISNPKQAVSFILQISQMQSAQSLSSLPSTSPSFPSTSPININQNIYKTAAANIISSYCPQRPSSITKVKTFDRQYSIESEIINVNSKLYVCLSLLIDCIMERNSNQANQILMWIMRLCNWLVIPVLNLPVSGRYDSSSQGKKLQSFSMWLISNPNYHSFLLQILELGLSISIMNARTYFIQICATTVCDQALIQINRVLGQLCELEDNTLYRYILKLILLFVRVCQASKPILPTNSSQLFRKLIRLYLRSSQKIDTVFMNVDDQQIPKQVADSIFQVYCPLLSMIHQSAQKCRKWRTAMHKICLTSLDFTIEQVFHARDYELPLIRKDKGFLIHNSVEQSKEKQSNVIITTNRVKSRIDSLLKDADKYQSKCIFMSHRENYEKQQNLISAKEIKDMKIQQNQGGLYSKQLLIPSLSLKLIKSMLSYQNNKILTQILSMSAGNHRKLTQLALLNKNTDLLMQIGLSKQSVESMLPQIIAVLTTEDQYLQLVGSLDDKSKKNISDNFNFMLMKQQLNCNDYQKIKEVLVKMCGELGFLIVQNQSNWRYFNQVLNQIGHIKPFSLSNTSSVLLQYMQYIRITSKPSQDYESKLLKYNEILQHYRNLLNQKLIHIDFLSQTNNEQQISAQQLKLYKTNQLAYINTFCQCWNVYDFLVRAAQFRKEVGDRVGDFGAAFAIVEQTVRNLLSVNQIGNIFGRGRVMGPDFVYAYSMCSEGAYVKGKLNLGESLQAYFKIIGMNPSQIYTYFPTDNSPPQPLSSLSNLTSPTNACNPPQDFIFDITKTKNDITFKKQISQKYSQFLKYLSENKVIEVIENHIQFMENQEIYKDQKVYENIEKVLFYFGVLYRVKSGADGNVEKLGELVKNYVQRRVLNWELVKTILPEAYHLIKAVLVDEQIQSRKYTFTYNNVPLLPQGQNIEVNKVNKTKYCNLVGKQIVGSKRLKRLTTFTQGFYSVIV